MSNWKNIILQQEEGWALLTLSRPKVLNALSQELLDELNEAVDWVEKTDSIRVLVFTGDGEKAFVAGADISEFTQVEYARQAEELALKGQTLFNRIENLPKPVIMAVNGYALGGGCELALCGDIILAAEHARFGQPEVNLGIIPGYGGTQRLARAVGRNMAKYLCMTGEMISAAEAHRLGLVQKVLPASELLKEAKDLAKQLAQKAPLAIQLIKKSIHHGLNVDLKTGLQLEASYFGLCFNTEDRIEGVNAFLEKRPPRFTGK